MGTRYEVNGATLELVQGDITEQEVDAIVNAANSALAGGGGVDGAIHRAGGPQIMAECREIGGCPTGEAVITTGGDLPAEHVIHTVGPRWKGGDRGEVDKLASAYRRSLEVADENRCRTVAFPSISTGAYGYPLHRAARIALGTAIDYLRGQGTTVKLVRFVLFSDGDLGAYEEALADVTG
jgi:O-acetyl-ADP-ribose deacetylase (regulator of RNase III)